MQTHVMSMKEGDNLFGDVVVAPDHDTARRVFAKRMLEHFDRTLEDVACTSLDDYAPSHALDEDWNAERSITCASCGCGSTRPLENREMAEVGFSPLQHGTTAHVCTKCAATWVVGRTFAPLRERLEREAAEEIAGLDEFERVSLEGGEA